MAKPKPLKIQQSNMFAAFDSIEELHAFMKDYAGENYFIAGLSISLTINTLGHIMEKECGGKAVSLKAEPMIKKEV